MGGISLILKNPQVEHVIRQQLVERECLLLGFLGMRDVTEKPEMNALLKHILG